MGRHGISLRGDALYCPLPLSIDPYQNCLVDCHHCYMRRLNHVWGKGLNPLDPATLFDKLKAASHRKDPKSSLGWALKLKKTIRIGNKADAFQPAEKEYRVTHEVLRILNLLKWSYVVQTRFMKRAFEYEKEIMEGNSVILALMSPGLDRDWSILEKEITDTPEQRMQVLRSFQAKGRHCGVNGEPFIPGFHTVEDFEETLKFIKSFGIRRYNTYNLHFNDFVAKRLLAIGLDIEKIWEMNQDKNWKPIQQQLCDLAIKYNIILGCPDFVNTGPNWHEQAVTCCGINVPNPSKFNTHFWKAGIQEAVALDEVLKNTWEGIGDYEMGEKIVRGTTDEFYTMADAEVISKKKKGLLI